MRRLVALTVAALDGWLPYGARQCILGVVGGAVVGRRYYKLADLCRCVSTDEVESRISHESFSARSSWKRDTLPAVRGTCVNIVSFSHLLYVQMKQRIHSFEYIFQKN